MAILGPDRLVDSSTSAITPPIGRRHDELGSVAIVHDYLNQPGGAERVVLALARMWPDAPVYTSLYRADSTFAGFGGTDIRSSPLDMLPIDQAFRNLFPLYPAAFRSFGVLDTDLVISSSSGWAHAVRTAPETFHAVYCHSPARWLYESEHLNDARSRSLVPFITALRTWDRTAARRAQLYIANSAEVSRRIARHYGIRAPVVHPPVEVGRFQPTPRGERLLIVSRLLPYKRVDAIVDTATRAGIGLDVVGSGPALEDLRRRAGPTVTFHGRLPDCDVVEMMERCRALCLPGKEDFGITPIEANAAGKPVVAFAGGGALETLEEGVTGAFFDRYDHDAILDAIARADAIDAAPEQISASTRRFSGYAFEVKLRDTLAEAMHNARSSRPPRPAPAPPPARAAAPTSTPEILMLGCGWFPDQLGGLNRYYRQLLEQLPEAHGVVIGAEARTPARLAGVSGHSRPLPVRAFSFWHAAQREASAADVVDAHFALYALLPLRLGRLRRKPLVFHFHGPWAAENVAGGDTSRLKLRLRLALERAAYRRADQAVVLTSAFRQVLVERYRVDPWIVNVVPPGVDLEGFSPASSGPARTELGLDAAAFVAVSVRRLVPRMGLESLIDAWNAALPSLPAGSTLLIAGEGQLEDQLRAQANRSGAGSVRVLGRVSDEQLASLYRAADIAIVPSLEHEGYGLVVLEAAACGTPSIVTAVGGLPEAVSGLDPSMIVPPDDSQALRDRIVRSVADRPSVAVTRAHAEGHSWTRVAARHREIAKRAISRKQNGRKNPTGVEPPLKVVYLDHVARLSGGEIALLRLLPHLDRVQPHVILAEDGPLVQEFHLAGISTEVLPFAEHARDLHRNQIDRHGVPVRTGAATAAYVARLARRLRQLQPDVVHANSLKSGVYGALAARLAGVPMVWHVRDRIDEDYMPAAAVSLVRRLARRLPTAVVANSETTMATLGLPAGAGPMSRVLPHVLDADPVAPHLAQREALRYGVVGRLAPWKGQDLFLRAFARAFAHGDERAILVGGALFQEEEYAAELPRLADQLGIAARVELRGHRTDVWGELAKMDVLVHSSISPEPFGQVILEGIAAGVPVIAADAGGPTEILQHDRTGLLYKPGDEVALAEALLRIKDPDLRGRLSGAAVKTLGAYSPATVSAQYHQLYADVVSARARGK